MLGALLNRLENIRKLDSKKVFHEVMENTFMQTEVLRLNTEEQLYELGVDSEGKTLGVYSEKTKRIKRIKGGDMRIDHVTLKDTGEFYRSFRFLNKPDGFVIQADTEKDDKDLTEVYGRKILGLTNESIQSIKPQITKDAIAIFRKKIRA